MYDIDPHTIKSQKNMIPTRADTILQVQRCGLYLKARHIQQQGMQEWWPPWGGRGFFIIQQGREKIRNVYKVVPPR